MRTIAASGLIALTAMLGVAASTAVASSGDCRAETGRRIAGQSAAAGEPAFRRVLRVIEILRGRRPQ